MDHSHSHHRNQETGTDSLLSDKTGFSPKLVRRFKQVHIKFIKGMVHQVEITILNIYTAKTQDIQLKKKKEIPLDLKPHININPVTVVDFNTLLSISRSSGPKLNRKTLGLNNIVN